MRDIYQLIGLQWRALKGQGVCHTVGHLPSAAGAAPEVRRSITAPLKFNWLVGWSKLLLCSAQSQPSCPPLPFSYIFKSPCVASTRLPQVLESPCSTAINERSCRDLSVFMTPASVFHPPVRETARQEIRVSATRSTHAGTLASERYSNYTRGRSQSEAVRAVLRFLDSRAHTHINSHSP